MLGLGGKRAAKIVGELEIIWRPNCNQTWKCPTNELTPDEETLKS